MRNPNVRIMLRPSTIALLLGPAEARPARSPRPTSDTARELAAICAPLQPARRARCPVRFVEMLDERAVALLALVIVLVAVDRRPT